MLDVDEAQWSWVFAQERHLWRPCRCGLSLYWPIWGWLERPCTFYWIITFPKLPYFWQNLTYFHIFGKNLVQLHIFGKTLAQLHIVGKTWHISTFLAKLNKLPYFWQNLGITPYFWQNLTNKFKRKINPFPLLLPYFKWRGKKKSTSTPLPLNSKKKKKKNQGAPPPPKQWRNISK